MTGPENKHDVENARGKKFRPAKKNGKFISVGEQRRRNSASLLCKRFCMNTEGEREVLDTAAEASSAVISWDEGKRVVELGFWPKV